MKKWTPPQRADVYSMLEVYDMNTNQREIVAEFDRVIEAPNWTPDGQSLIYNSLGRIYRFDLDSRESRLIDTGYVASCNNDHVLSPDGRLLGISAWTAEDQKSRVYIVPITGGTPRLITPVGPSYLHGWSPDGKTLAYCGNRDGIFDVYALPAEGGVETQLTDAPGLNDGPEYSPDGGHIWFNSVRTGLMQVWRMNPDGSEQTQMTCDEGWNSWFPHVSPDGRDVVYICYKKGDVDPGAHPPDKNVEIRHMPASGGAPRTLAKFFGGQGSLNVNSWAPDSRRFAFVSYRLK